MNKIYQLALLSLLAIGSANAAAISLVNSTVSAESNTTGLTAGEVYTTSAFSLGAGNAVVVAFGAEGADGITATYGGEAMTVLNAFSGDKFVSSFAYLINPIASTGDVVINSGLAAGETRISSIYSVFSLSNVDSLAGSDSRLNDGTLGYTTTTADGYVLVASVNNDFNGPATTVTGGNATTEIFSGAVAGNMSTVFAHGTVSTAGAYTETIARVAGSNFNESANLVAFNAVIPEPSSFALLAGMFGLTCVMLRRRA